MWEAIVFIEGLMAQGNVGTTYTPNPSSMQLQGLIRHKALYGKWEHCIGELGFTSNPLRHSVYILTASHSVPHRLQPTLTCHPWIQLELSCLLSFLCRVVNTMLFFPILSACSHSYNTFPTPPQDINCNFLWILLLQPSLITVRVIYPDLISLL
jgi:hypothetical protein